MKHSLQFSLFPAVQYLTSRGYSTSVIANEFGVSNETIRKSKKRFGDKAEFLEEDFSKGRVIYVFNDLITDNIVQTLDINDGIIVISGNLCAGYDDDSISDKPLWATPFTSAGDLVVDNIKCGFVVILDHNKELDLSEFTFDFERYKLSDIVENGQRLFESTYCAKSARLPRFMSSSLARDKPSNFIATDKSITITSGLESTTIDFSHPRFTEAMNVLLNTRDASEAIKLVNLEKEVKTYFEHKDIKVIGGEVLYKDRTIHSSLTKRIIKSLDNNEPFMKYIMFMENLMQNPSNKATLRLFDFLEANDIEITDDGYFIAFKRVGSDFTDLYTGKMLNAPGEVLQVDRNTVDEDDNRTCSTGLHVCSKSYLPHFGCNARHKIVRCKVNPCNVVSIPVDYDNAKMRTCGYVVIDEITL